ncbi:hypothetical protein TNCV_2444231 [Trichonephila clavipes]|nr:hypothetical protein TNCV_2444231 [Trichonephila clavipes]
MIQYESTHSASVMKADFRMTGDIYSTIGQPISFLLLASMIKNMVRSTYTYRYGMEARFESHMPSYCTEGTNEGERILERTWLVSPRCEVVFGNTRLRGKRSAMLDYIYDESVIKEYCEDDALPYFTSRPGAHCEDPLGSHFENENDFESNKNQ